jgi:UDP-N-acetylmuramoylalanine--D-glutamate ligase
LDWHSSLKDYLLSKWNIFKNQREKDFLIVNRCQEETLQTPTCAKKITFGCNGDIYIYNYGRVYFKDVFLFEERDILLKGKHNLFNAAVAATVGYLLGIEIYNIQRALREFKGLPHRLEYVGKFGGIEIYNDSKATTPHALEAALKSFKKRVVLIAGGKDKGSDFSYLKPLVRKKVKIAILYGENRQKIARQWEGITKIYTVGSLEYALHFAKKLLQRGDILLFSPASASFDSFSSYIERGEVFKKLVKELFK